MLSLKINAMPVARHKGFDIKAAAIYIRKINSFLGRRYFRRFLNLMHKKIKAAGANPLLAMPTGSPKISAALLCDWWLLLDTKC